MKKIKRKIKIKRKVKIIFLKLIVIISITTTIYSSFHIIRWIKDNNNSKKEISKIKEKTKLTKVKPNETEIKVIDEEKIQSSDPYWDFTKMDYLNVNFSDLVNQNKETVAWIKVNGTNINYPVVQHKDNEYYLNHSFNKFKNKAGWIFMDYRNNINNLEKNTIIYAHGRKDGTMFGSLKNILSNKWYSSKNNFIINFSTQQKNMLWQIFSIYKIPTTNDYIQINFLKEKDFSEFLNTVTNRSIYDFKTTADISNNILTLSTCYSESEKLVVHAKLIKIQEKN